MNTLSNTYSSNFLNILKWVGLFFLLLIKGFGNIFLMKLGVLIPLTYFFINSCYSKNFQQVFTFTIFIIVAYLEWPIIHLWGFWALASFIYSSKICSFSLGACSSFLVLWLLQESELGSWSVLPHLVTPLFTLLLVLGSKFKTKILYPLLILCILITSITIYQNISNKPTIQISLDKTVAKGYSTGPLLAKILNAQLVNPGEFSAEIGISNLIFDQGPFNSSKFHILLNEHDLMIEDDHILKANAQQKEPWIFNQMIGNQYILEAISRDGCWMGNLGGSLKPTGKLILGSYSHISEQFFTPLIIKCDKYIYVQDSDSFVDRVASRQVNTVSETCLGRLTPRVINIIFCLLFFLPTTLLGFVTRNLGLLLVICILKLPVQGDIRFQASIDWPHEPSKASGVLASLTDNGFYLLQGNSETKILIVGEGYTAKPLTSEKLIIMEPNAVLDFDDQEITAGNDPLGEVDEIVDARMLYIDGIPSSPKLILKGKKIIGTGSPAKIDWKRWCT